MVQLFATVVHVGILIAIGSLQAFLVPDPNGLHAPFEKRGLCLFHDAADGCVDKIGGCCKLCCVEIGIGKRTSDNATTCGCPILHVIPPTTDPTPVDNSTQPAPPVPPPPPPITLPPSPPPSTIPSPPPNTLPPPPSSLQPPPPPPVIYGYAPPPTYPPVIYYPPPAYVAPSPP